MAQFTPASRFVTPGFLLGIGLGGFFDGIVLHQLLQWHHLLSSAHPVIAIADLQVNTFWDGVFHGATYVFTVAGVVLMWRATQGLRRHLPARTLVGAVLMGWGVFNLVEGLVDHQILGLHHVNETVPRENWIYWDLGFLAWGAAMAIGGWALARGPVTARTGGGES
jgi:uncharacterized membrane protein